MREAIYAPRDTPCITFIYVSNPCVFFCTAFRDFNNDTLYASGFHGIIINIFLIIGNINYFHMYASYSTMYQSSLSISA